MVTLAQATAAAPLAQQIADRQTKLAQLNQMIADGTWTVTQLAAQNSAGGGQPVSLILASLDPATTLQCLQFAVQVYQNQITALTTQLTAI